MNSCSPLYVTPHVPFPPYGLSFPIPPFYIKNIHRSHIFSKQDICACKAGISNKVSLPDVKNKNADSIYLL